MGPEAKGKVTDTEYLFKTLTSFSSMDFCINFYFITDCIIILFIMTEFVFFFGTPLTFVSPGVPYLPHPIPAPSLQLAPHLELLLTLLSWLWAFRGDPGILSAPPPFPEVFPFKFHRLVCATSSDAVSSILVVTNP